ncbi:MAG: CoA pyrophosphatase [Burkholderiales bacterium]|nr:CoA pyrophosphatase [Burkholderiales bacterium]
MSILFDPQTAPVVAQDHHLPHVPQDRLTYPALVQRFAQPPQWQPDVMGDRMVPDGPRVAASVLVPLVMREQPTVLLTQRQPHLKAHAGQISFPGGRSEPSDADAIHTALREAQEEVGLNPDRVRILGTLPSYNTISGFMVTPVVGVIDVTSDERAELSLQPDPGEVAEVFEVPLEFLMNPGHHQRRSVPVPGSSVEFYAMPWTPPGLAREYFIWGATAAMLRNLYRFLSA